MDFIQRCRKIIAIESTPSTGNWQLSQWFGEYAGQLGLQVEIQSEENLNPKQANVIARPTIQDSLKNLPEILFQTHLDTSEPGPFNLWTKTSLNPFDAHIEDQKIFGLGAANCKLDFLCKLEAFKLLKDRLKDPQWKVPPVFVGTFGEETGMTGALKLIRKNRVRPARAFIGEPTGLELVVAAKGLAVVEIQIPFEPSEIRYRSEHNLIENASTQSKMFSGKAAHSSNPQKGESAIKKVFEYLQKLPTDITIMNVEGGVSFNSVPAQAFLEFDLGSQAKMPMSTKLQSIYQSLNDLNSEFIHYEDRDFSPAYPTLNIGVIRTGEDSIWLSGCCRVLPKLDEQQTYERWMSFLRTECEKVSAHFRIRDYKRPFITNKNSEFIVQSQEILSELGLSPDLKTQPSSNEASLFSRLGMDVVCFGPGLREGNVQTSEEHVEIRQLESAILFYQKALEKFCL